MSNSRNTKYPIIQKGEKGYWHAFGEGWAVCAKNKKEVEEKYKEMLDLIRELISRPVIKASDIL